MKFTYQVLIVMKNLNPRLRVERAIKRLRGLFSCTIAAAFIWMGTSVTSMLYAEAATMQVFPQLMTTSTVENTIEELDEKVKSDLDTVAGSGTSDRLEGQVDRAAGKAKRDLGRVSGEAEGALQEARGKAKEDIGRTKNAIDDATDEIQESSKGFFNNLFGR